MQSQGGGIRGPSTAEAGTTVTIEVQGGAREIEVGISGTGVTTSYPVPPSKKVQVPVPPGTQGGVLLHTAG
jgi:hypothetical protein